MVCDKCWNSPDMFFPEKINEDQRLNLLSRMAQQKGDYNGIIEINAIKFNQKEVEMYVGKMKVTDILNLYELDKFKEEELEGYQRERYEERTSQIVEYIEKSPLAVMPALLVGLRQTDFVPIKDNVGILRINRKKGAIWIIDGQHRVGGFSKIREQFLFTKSLGASLFTDLMDYELPVVFIDSKSASEKIKPKGAGSTSSLSAEDIEKTIFFIVNKTQRGISPSLKDALLYTIKTSGIEGLAIVDKEGCRILGAEIAITLNLREDSPLRAKINVSGRRNSGKPIQLNSFVSSLEILFKDKEFYNLTVDDKVCFLEAYWLAIRGITPQAFKDSKEARLTGEEFGRRFSSNINDKARKSDMYKQLSQRYLLLTALGVHALHRLARDLLHIAIRKGISPFDVEFYKQTLDPLKCFDWNSKSSPLSALGGMKGVSKAYELLSNIIAQEKFVESVYKKLDADQA
jgi:DGQHR domain-containing protein